MLWSCRRRQGRDRPSRDPLSGPATGPLSALSLRLAAAIGLVFATVAVVYLDRDGYRDVNEDALTLLDCFYYAVVTLSTTGYGDITPVSQTARLINVVYITPARVIFLIILVGTTLEVLTEQYRTGRRLSRWRRAVKDHVIICGYGTKGRSAVSALMENGLDKSRIVVVERSGPALRQATSAGLVAIEGSATRSSVLNEAHVRNAKAVIIATDSDDASVLVALTVRQLTAGQVRIIAAAREAENAPLLKQSGAHHVIVSSATAGRLLGLSTSAPPLIDVVEDLLTPARAWRWRCAPPSAPRWAGRPASWNRWSSPWFGGARWSPWPTRPARSSRPATCWCTYATTARTRQPPPDPWSPLIGRALVAGRGRPIRGSEPAPLFAWSTDPSVVTFGNNSSSERHCSPCPLLCIHIRASYPECLVRMRLQSKGPTRSGRPVSATFNEFAVHRAANLIGGS